MFTLCMNSYLHPIFIPASLLLHPHHHNNLTHSWISCPGELGLQPRSHAFRGHAFLSSTYLNHILSPTVLFVVYPLSKHILRKLPLHLRVFHNSEYNNRHNNSKEKDTWYNALHGLLRIQVLAMIRAPRSPSHPIELSHPNSWHHVHLDVRMRSSWPAVVTDFLPMPTGTATTPCSSRRAGLDVTLVQCCRLWYRNLEFGELVFERNVVAEEKVLSLSNDRHECRMVDGMALGRTVCSRQVVAFLQLQLKNVHTFVLIWKNIVRQTATRIQQQKANTRETILKINNEHELMGARSTKWRERAW